MTNGGANRITLSWVSLHNNFFSLSLSINFLAPPDSGVSSMAINRPRPRISAINHFLLILIFQSNIHPELTNFQLAFHP